MAAYLDALDEFCLLALGSAERTMSGRDVWIRVKTALGSSDLPLGKVSRSLNELERRRYITGLGDHASWLGGDVARRLFIISARGLEVMDRAEAQRERLRRAVA